MNTLTAKNSSAGSRENWDALVALAETVFAAFLKRMDAAMRRGDFESALQWGSTAAGFLVRGGTFGHLASIELEQKTLQIAAQLPKPTWARGGRTRPHVLHVITEAYELFGHTKLCRQWIELDAGRNVHDVVLLEQGPFAPENLRRVIVGNGGNLVSLDWKLPMLERARQLRELAFQNADFVVLHAHPDDVLPNVAFGVAGGPPVLYVNHADHAFWVGGMVADVVLDIRESGHDWTRRHRGVARSRILPIPLDEDPLLLQGPEKIAALRRETRKALKIPENAVMFLTIGATRKYWPLRGISFLEVAERILHQCPEAWLVAIGPTLNGDWQAVSQRVEGRLLALGNQANLGRFHAAADVYLEGMPAGSLTALLEAALAGLPCVRAMAQVKPPHSSDGAAFDETPQPADLSAYVQQAVALAGAGTGAGRTASAAASTRRERGLRLQQRARAVHGAEGWRKALDEILPSSPLIQPDRELEKDSNFIGGRLELAGSATAEDGSLPSAHAIYPAQRATQLEPSERDYWLEYIYRSDLPAARVKLLATAIEQASRRCADARRAIEQVLPAVVGRGALGLEQQATEAILPELAATAREILAAAPQPVLQFPVFTKELMYRAADEGRRVATLVLAMKLVVRRPRLLGQPEFLKGVVKNLPGGESLLRWKKRSGN